MGFVSKMPLRRHPACASTPGASRPTRPSPGEVRRLLLGGHRSPCGSVGASRRAIGPGMPLPVLVPPLPFLTTSAACSAHVVQVCCTLLPTMGFAWLQACVRSGSRRDRCRPKPDTAGRGIEARLHLWRIGRSAPSGPCGRGLERARARDRGPGCAGGSLRDVDKVGSEDPAAVAGRDRCRGRSHRIYPCRPSRVTTPKRCFSKTVRSTTPAVSSRALPSGAVTLRSLSLVHSRTASPRPLPSRRSWRPVRPASAVTSVRRPVRSPRVPRALLHVRVRCCLPACARPAARCSLGLPALPAPLTPLPKEGGAGARERLTSKSQPVGLVRSCRPSFQIGRAHV